jgi:hypothetical protein
VDDVDMSLMNTKTEGELEQQLMVSTAGRGCIIPFNRNLKNSVTQNDFKGNIKCKAEQPAAILVVTEDDQEVQYSGRDDRGSLGHKHRDSLASEDSAMDHETASEAGSGSGVPTKTSPAAPPPLSVMPPSSQSCPPSDNESILFIHPHSKF